MNRQMPRSMGDTFLHVSKVSAIVETDRPLLELPMEQATPIEERIAANVASLIPDGAVLQTGIGAVPDAVLRYLRDRKALGVHGEMCSDGVIDLIEAGVLTGERKNIHRGKIVVGFVLGTKRLFTFLHENPIFEMHPTYYTNDPYIIAHNDRMIAINSAIQVDLTGPGVRRFDWHQALQRIRRPGGLHSRRGAVEGRQADHRATVDGEEWNGFADRSHAGARRRGRHHARRRALRGHRARNRGSARQEHSPAH